MSCKNPPWQTVLIEIENEFGELVKTIRRNYNMKTIDHTVNDLDCEVTLFQTGKDLFTVQYGKHIKTKLNYANAAIEYGKCIMHSATCSNRIDCE